MNTLLRLPQDLFQHTMRFYQPATPSARCIHDLRDHEEKAELELGAMVSAGQHGWYAPGYFDCRRFDWHQFSCQTFQDEVAPRITTSRRTSVFFYFKYYLFEGFH